MPSRNSLLLLLAVGANPFQIKPTRQNRPFYSPQQSEPLFAANGFESSTQESSQIPAPCNYTDPNGSQVLVPSVGHDFRKLDKEEHNKVLKKLYDINGGLFQYLKFEPDKVDEIIIGSKETLNKYEDVGNCFNFATNTRYNNTYTNTFPGKVDSMLNSTNHQDNVDELDNSMIEEFGSKIRISKRSEGPKDDEQKVKSYISEETFKTKNGQTFRDIHFAKKSPNDSSYWHKPGGLAAKILDDESVKNGRIKATNTIWIITDNNNIDSDEIGYIEGIGKIDSIKNTDTPAYKECSNFSLKIKEEQQNTQQERNR